MSFLSFLSFSPFIVHAQLHCAVLAKPVQCFWWIDETKRLRVRRMLTVDSREQCCCVGGPMRMDVQHNAAGSERCSQFATNFGKSLFSLLAEMSAVSAISATFMNYYYFSSGFSICLTLLQFNQFDSMVGACCCCYYALWNYRGKLRGERTRTKQKERCAKRSHANSLFIRSTLRNVSESYSHHWIYARN